MTENPARSGRSAGELVLAALFLESTPGRLGALRQAAQALGDWGPVPLLLESHGILVLARRNLALAAAEIPEDAQRVLARREAALREVDLCFRLTLERFLVEAARYGIEITLLKGASLALDLYPDPALRSQGDLDLLVHPRDVRPALLAAERAGLFPPPGALPLWWYRLAHFHAKLSPESPLLREVELHWALAHPSQLLTVGLDELLERRQAVEVAGSRAWALERLDRLLHLVTHLASHAAHAPLERDRESLIGAASTPGHPLRLKWLLDVQAEVERMAGSTGPEDLARRAGEWNAERELCAALEWVRDGLGFEPQAGNRVEKVLGALPRDAPGSRRRSRTPRPAKPDSRPMPALDFRSVALARFPRWVFPPRRFFSRPGESRSTPLVLRRALHAARVLAGAALACCALPFALLGELLARSARAHARRRASSPERVLELAADARSLSRRDPRARRAGRARP